MSEAMGKAIAHFMLIKQSHKNQIAIASINERRVKVGALNQNGPEHEHTRAHRTSKQETSTRVRTLHSIASYCAILRHNA